MSMGFGYIHQPQGPHTTVAISALPKVKVSSMRRDGLFVIVVEWIEAVALRTASEAVVRVGNNLPLMQTTMSNPNLPPEMLDHVVNFLHDDIEALRRCCLVSKSWVPRARKHLFAVVQFGSSDDIDAWKKIFSDPPNSPAHHTRILSISHFDVVTAEDAAEGGWIPTFSRVAYLDLDHGPLTPLTVPSGISLAPFHNFSLALKTLRVTCFLLRPPRVIDLIRSFPLLEDLTLIGHDPKIDDNERDGPHTDVPSSASPKLTGTLKLFLFGGVAVTLRQLLDLPNGVHFRSIELSWCEEKDFRYLVELMVACSGTLEDLSVTYEPEGMASSVYSLTRHLPEFWSAGESTPSAIDLSTATKLKNIEFRCETFEIGWVVRTLETLGSKQRGLRQISIRVPSDLVYVAAEDCAVVEQRIEKANPGTRWSDLDRVLVRLWESHVTHVTVVYPQPGRRRGAREMKDWAVYLLPEVTKRGIIDLVEEPS